MRRLKLVALIFVAHFLLSVFASFVGGAASMACFDRPCETDERLAIGASVILSFPVVYPLSMYLPGYHGGIGSFGLRAVNSVLWSVAVVLAVGVWRRLSLARGA